MNTNPVNESQLSSALEIQIEKAWTLFVATTDFLEPLDHRAQIAAKAAFRDGFFNGISAATQVFATNIHSVLDKVEKAGK